MASGGAPSSGRPPDGAPSDGAAVRTTFRRRLLVTLGTGLAVAFIVLGVIAWFAAYAWLTYNAHMVLHHEAREVVSNVVTPGGRLNVNRYTWYEPHHRFAERRIDPMFVQVFDADGRLLRASRNIDDLTGGTYPGQLLDVEYDEEQLLKPVRTFRVGANTLYYLTVPITNPQGERLGFVQVARYDPGIPATLRQFTTLLLVVLVLMLAGFFVLIGWVAGRVLEPLESITQATRAISPEKLDRRFPVPDTADRETAQLAETLNTLMERLEHSFEEMRRFTSNAAHELQTPLTVLRGHVDVALRRERSPESYRRTLQLLGTEIDHLVRMTRSLLVLARMDQDQRPPLEARVDLVAVVRRELRALGARASEKGLAMETDLPAEAQVCGVPELLRDVVLNLVDNAIKYTETGTIAVRIHREEEDAVVLTVADTGIGIDPEALTHVTDRFYRVGSVEANGVSGHGLGLSLVERIAVLHDARLEIRSEPRRGTTVHVRFPATE